MSDGEVAPYYTDRNAADYYDILEEIGRGAFSVVKKGKHKQTGELYALKILNKDKVKAASLQREIEIMQRIRHPHILSMKEVYEPAGANTVTIVLDMVEGGELFQKIVERGHLSENDAASVVRQILEAVKYLHANRITHRDLKPENILVSDKSKLSVYVSDFGLSRLLKADDLQQMSTQCGSLEYCAPEILLGQPYTNSVDLWSIGVITYILLTGFFPFFDPDRNAALLYEKIQAVKYDWDDCPPTTDTAKDFVKNLLLHDPNHRMSAEQALMHPWLKGSKLSSDNLDRSFSNLFKTMLHIKKKGK